VKELSLEHLKTDGPYPVYRLRRLRDYIGLLEKHLSNEFAIFRGQSRDWELVPRIASRQHVMPILDNERAMFNAFRHEAISFLDPEPSSEWEWLAVAQHHGLPTRLLDWSTNALGALWFAVRHPAAGSNPGAIWIYMPEDSDVIRSTGVENSPFSADTIKIYLPRHTFGRLRSQSGAFTVHTYLHDQGRFLPLDESPLQNHRLIKILIPADSFPLIRHDLYRCGIHAGSLFPDVGGTAERIRNMYVYQEDEDQDTVLKWKY